MISICFVVPKANIFFTETNQKKIGGAEKQLYYLGKQLSKDKYFNVNFCVADCGQPQVQIVENITAWKSFSYEQSFFKRFFAILPVLRKINSDIYVFRAPDIGILPLILFLRYVLKKKTYYMLAHDNEIRSKSLSKMSGIFTSIVMKFAYRMVHVISAQSVHQQKEFENSRNIRIRTIIPNIIISDVIYNDPELESKEYVIWVGRCIQIKYPDLFIQLAQKYPMQKFLMICLQANEPDLWQNVVSLVKGVKNLAFHSFVHPEEIDLCYKKSRIFVSTSHSEGFPNTMLEALLHKCAVLSYSVNPDNIINTYNLGFCSDNNEELFFHNFEKLSKNSQLTESFGKNGHNYVLSHHNADFVIEKFKTLLKTI